VTGRRRVLALAQLAAQVYLLRRQMQRERLLRQAVDQLDDERRRLRPQTWLWPPKYGSAAPPNPMRLVTGDLNDADIVAAYQAALERSGQTYGPRAVPSSGEAVDGPA
jgi:NAD(P)-dependent dehydrogenase (short-subunit alcohol dehydrogenase family)